MSPEPDIRLTRTRPEPGIWKVSLSLNGAEVSRLWVVIKRMRIGSGTVRIGGIAGVDTNREHRLRGYSSRVMRESTRLIGDLKCEMGFLFGIRDFYHRFGYSVGFPQTVLRVPAPSLARARPLLATRMFREDDAPAVRRVYNRQNAERTGTIVRPAGWRYFGISVGFKAPDRTVVALDRQDRVVGYAMVGRREDRLTVSEVEALNPDALEALAEVLSRRVRRAGLGGADVHVPVGHGFESLGRRLGCSREVEYPRNGGPMARIVRLPALVDRLLPELSRRAARAGLTGAVTLRTDLGDVALRAAEGRVTRMRKPAADVPVARMPQDVLSQLVMGCRSVADAAEAPDVHVPRSALSLLHGLFPPGHPYMGWPDRF